MTFEYATKLSEFQFGDMMAEYTIENETRNVGFRLYPAALAQKLVTRREYLKNHETLLLPDFMSGIRAWRIEPLVQIKMLGDKVSGFSQGVSMRNSDSVFSLRFIDQVVSQEKDLTRINTLLRSPQGYTCEHQLLFKEGDEALTVQTSCINESKADFKLELLSSFSLSGLTPFAEDDAPNRLYLHRFLSSWSSEGRHVCQSIEELNLERSWSGHGVRSERYGQVGSMPVRKYFPFIGVEDRVEGTFWGAQLEWNGSWQMEAYRRDDQLCISGGLADHEFGHWIKNIAPGEKFVSPSAFISTVEGNLDDLCQRLTSMQISPLEELPKSEETLPVIANEWCTSWGNPEHDRIIEISSRLKDTGAKYLVIDAGWYHNDKSGWEFTQGEWEPNKRLFPDGIATTTAAIRRQGLIPGIWFEFEVIGCDSPLFESMTGHFLKMDGIPITAGNRRFWDFRDKWVHEYLQEKVISFLKKSGIGYVKVDYNESLGIGVDGAESLGEGLRQHLLGVQEFFREMRRQIPELVIEVCASGGHRLEPSMMALSSMGSFSDAHESLAIPIIAANLHRLIQPRQSQIWAVLHKSDTDQRLYYSLSAGFLGRLCLSGDLDCLDETQWTVVKNAIHFYQTISSIIKDGKSRLYQYLDSSWRYPRGAQAIVRLAKNGNEALLVFHSFAFPLPGEMDIMLPEGTWKVTNTFSQKKTPVEIKDNHLRIRPASEFEGWGIQLKRDCRI